jgi:hypothetical protein
MNFAVPQTNKKDLADLLAGSQIATCDPSPGQKSNFTAKSIAGGLGFVKQRIINISYAIYSRFAEVLYRILLA